MGCVATPSYWEGTLDGPFKKHIHWRQKLIDGSSKTALMQLTGPLHKTRLSIFLIQFSQQVMTSLRMPLSVEAGKAGEFDISTDTEQKFIFLFEKAVIMRERSRLHIAGAQNFNDLRKARKRRTESEDKELIWERFQQATHQLSPSGNFLLILPMTLRSMHTKICLLISCPCTHPSVYPIFILKSRSS